MVEHLFPPKKKKNGTSITGRYILQLELKVSNTKMASPSTSLDHCTPTLKKQRSSRHWGFLRLCGALILQQFLSALQLEMCFPFLLLHQRLSPPSSTVSLSTDWSLEVNGAPINKHPDGFTPSLWYIHCSPCSYMKTKPKYPDCPAPSKKKKNTPFEVLLCAGPENGRDTLSVSWESWPVLFPVQQP